MVRAGERSVYMHGSPLDGQVKVFPGWTLKVVDPEPMRWDLQELDSAGLVMPIVEYRVSEYWHGSSRYCIAEVVDDS